MMNAIAEFDRALPDLKRMRDVAEHFDDYAVDDGHRKEIMRQSLESSSINEDGPALIWLDRELNAEIALQASKVLFIAIQDAERLLEIRGSG